MNKKFFTMFLFALFTLIASPPRLHAMQEWHLFSAAGGMIGHISLSPMGILSLNARIVGNPNDFPNGLELCASFWGDPNDFPELTTTPIGLVDLSADGFLLFTPRSLSRSLGAGNYFGLLFTIRSLNDLDCDGPIKAMTGTFVIEFKRSR